ncbi:MAG: oxidoreductase [Bacteroidales bacterium]|nr:oxidoreductase [Bacteroidales bacterium]
MKNKTAIVLGATGLTGFNLTKTLIEDEDFDEIVVLSRRKTGLLSDKLKEFMVDFDNPESYKDYVKGDVLFSCMGTTIKKAKKKSIQYKVDVTYQLDVAKAAEVNRVPDYVLVSAPGANKKSLIFYSRIKGILEEEIEKLSFNRKIIFRPSVLIGEREERRKNEEFADKFMRVFIKIFPFLKKYRGISGQELAQAMINSYKVDKENRVYILSEIFKLL